MIIDSRYDMLKFAYAPVDLLVVYLEKLHSHDLLKERFTDLPLPTPILIVDLICKSPDKFFFMLDHERKQIIGEFMISDTIGDTGVVHFSMSPDVKGHEVFYLIREGTNEILLHWKKEKSLVEPFVKALIGLTPIENRRACLVIQRCGFKKLAIVPYAGKYEGKICDAMLSIKTIN